MVVSRHNRGHLQRARSHWADGCLMRCGLCRIPKGRAAMHPRPPSFSGAKAGPPKAPGRSWSQCIKAHQGSICRKRPIVLCAARSPATLWSK